MYQVGEWRTTGTSEVGGRERGSPAQDPQVHAHEVVNALLVSHSQRGQRRRLVVALIHHIPPVVNA